MSILLIAALIVAAGFVVVMVLLSQPAGGGHRRNDRETTGHDSWNSAESDHERHMELAYATHHHHVQSSDHGSGTNPATGHVYDSGTSSDSGGGSYASDSGSSCDSGGGSCGGDGGSSD
jgi:uncharacterized membrane protein YgcG